MTSDINNQIKIWTINTNTDVELNDIDDFNISNSSGQIAIWSLCLTKDDQYLLVGLSNGQLTLFDLEGIDLLSFINKIILKVNFKTRFT